MESISPTLPTITKLSNTPGQLLVQRLSKYGFDRAELEAFAAYLDRATDTELFRLNPRRAAAKAEIDLRRAIEIAALATREGIFDLYWEIGCHMCSAPVYNYSNLNLTPDHSIACPACQTKNVADADHNLRVLFSLNRAVREINLPVPKMVVPEGVEAGDIQGYLATLKPEEKMLIEEFIQLTAEHAPTTALDLMHIQLFRDFFKDQVLPVHVSLKVTRVALVFTDLRGSTAMYAAKGDPQAYNLVRQHFTLLSQATLQNGGVVIKTIGDAVMASFKHEVDAVRAAADFHKAIAAFNLAEGLSPKDALILKVGVHAGPCLSVNQNDLMDYFGTTVNMAARIAALSKGGDIIVSKELLEDKQVKEVLVAAGYTLRDSATVTLRGMSQSTEVCQLVALDSPIIIEQFAPRQLGQTA